jgi:hypothetical protein
MIGRGWVGLLLLVAVCGLCAQSELSAEAGPAIQITAVRKDGITVRLRSLWPYDVSVWVCDQPPRLDGLGFEIELLRDKKWVRLKPQGISGDLPGILVEIGPGTADSLAAKFLPAFLGIHNGMRLRLVVRAWRTQRNLAGAIIPLSREPLLLTSRSFIWTSNP